MDRQMTLTECLAMIETEVGKYRGAAGSQKEEQKQSATLQKQGVPSKNQVAFDKNSEDEAFEAD